jgi:hypothetical protein
VESNSFPLPEIRFLGWETRPTHRLESFLSWQSPRETAFPTLVFREKSERVESEITVETAMKADSTVEFLRFFVDGPELFGAQVVLQAIRRDVSAHHPEFFDSPSKLYDRITDVLHRMTATALKRELLFKYFS